MGIEYRYELAGVEAGKTVNKGGFQFEKGVYIHETDVTNVVELTRYLARCYNAHPVGSDELAKANEAFAAIGDKTPATPPQRVTQSKVPSVSLTEAINSLDPENDDHWTAAGLPQVDAVSALVGSPQTRADIEGAAKDFNRSAAKAAASL